MTEPNVNSEVPPSQVFGKNASNVKSFPAERPSVFEPDKGYANFEDGIPADYSSGATNSLKAMIEDVNAIGRLASSFHYYRQSGGLVTYSEEVSELIGGYPKGAVLEYWTGTSYRRVASLIENNKYDFVKTPSYIDGIHWVYVDSWGSPYGIFVDPSRWLSLEALSGGNENQELGWSDDDSAYQYVVEDPAINFFGKLVLRKSKWIRIEFDSFVFVSVVQTAQITDQDPNRYYVYAGFRQKDSAGAMSKYPMTIDEAGSTDYGSIYPVFGLVPSGNSLTGTVGYYTDVGSTCLYMRAGTFIQLVYATALAQKMDISLQIVRLRR